MCERRNAMIAAVRLAEKHIWNVRVVIGLYAPSAELAAARALPNKRMEFARGARPTRKGEAPLLAAQRRR